MSQKKGNFIIRNAEGSVVLAGLAALVNDAESAEFTDATELVFVRDAGNVRRTLIKDENVFRLSLRLTPGVGYAFADQAAVKAAIAALRNADTITTSGFEDADFNWDAAAKAIVMSVSKALTKGDQMSLVITAEKYTDTAGTVLDFTGAWAAL